MTLNVNTHRHSKRNLNGGVGGGVNGFDDEMEEVERSEEKKSMDFQSASRQSSNPQITDAHHLNHSSFTAASSHPSGHDVNVSQSNNSQETILYHGGSRGGALSGRELGRGQNGRNNQLNQMETEQNLQIQAISNMLSSQHSHSHSNSNSHGGSRSRSRNSQSIQRAKPPPPARDHKNEMNQMNAMNPGHSGYSVNPHSAQISVISPSVEKEEADYDDEEHPELPRKYDHRSNGNGLIGMDHNGNGMVDRNFQFFDENDYRQISMTLDGIYVLNGTIGVSLH